jgi:hypothetical protein
LTTGSGILTRAEILGKRYTEALEEKENLKERLKEANKRLDALQRELAQAMLLDEQARVTVDGVSLSVHLHRYYNVYGSRHLKFFRLLEEDGFGDAVKSSINDKDFKAVIKALEAENAGELPLKYEDAVRVYEQWEISRRRVKSDD